MDNIQIRDWNEGLRMRFYLGKVNSRGWGVIYLFMQVKERRMRYSLGCKVRADYWHKGSVTIPLTSSKVDRLLHDVAIKRMEEVRGFVDDVVYNYIMGHESKYIDEQIKKMLNKFKNMKNKTQTPIVLTWDKIVEEHYSGKSKNTMSGRVKTFRRFLEDQNIMDDIESLTTETMRKYKKWLLNEKFSVAHLNQSLAFVKNMCRKMKEEGLTHNIDFDCISKVTCGISQEEKTEGQGALTMDEVKALAELKLTDTKELVRDLFLIQCYSGVRYEDIPLFLNEKKLTSGGDMIRFTPKKTAKYGTTSRVPLRAYYPQLEVLWNKYKGYSHTKSLDTYNRQLRDIAKSAGLDRVLTRVSQLGRKRLVENKKVYEVISSHDGRRTFITSMVRDFKLKPQQIILMSGHTNIKMITDVYECLAKEDKDKSVMEVAKKVMSVSDETIIDLSIKRKEESETISTTPHNQNIKDKEEAVRVLSYLGVSLTAKDMETLDFNELCRMIEMKHSDLMDNFGIDVKEVKDIFNFHKPMIVRRGILKSMIDIMRGQ